MQPSRCKHDLDATWGISPAAPAGCERALKCGFPERFAQQALGHKSKAVHRAYAKHAEVTVPSLADWEKDWQENAQRATHEKFKRGTMACFRASQQ